MSRLGQIKGGHVQRQDLIRVAVLSTGPKGLCSSGEGIGGKAAIIEESAPIWKVDTLDSNV